MMMLTYDMDAREGLPLYEYLYQRIRDDIFRGALPAGTRLPSKRALAEHLQLSVTTVESAYQQLEAEGYLSARPRQGFFVNSVECPPCAASLSPVPPEPPSPSWRLDLSRDQMDSARFPVGVWARLTRQVLSQGSFLAPSPNQGLPELRRAIAQELRRSRGMAVQPEQIVVGAGAEYLYLLLAQLFGRHTVYALEDPGYPKIRQVYENWGALCRPVPLDAQGMLPEALRDCGASVAHLSPNHHYPTGLVTPIGRRQALLRWARERDGYLIEDDYDSEFRFAGRPIPTMQSIDSSGRVVYMNTFSQTISPSMRIGFMVLPPGLLAAYRARLDMYACTVPVLEQSVLARFLSDGHYEQHLSRMRKEYRARRAAVLEAFQTGTLAGRVTVSEQAAGLHFLLRLDTEESDETLRETAAGMGVKLRFLSEYAVVPMQAYAHTLVVNYAGLHPRRLPELMALLQEILFHKPGNAPEMNRKRDCYD